MDTFDSFQSGRNMANQEADATAQRQRTRQEAQYRQSIMNSSLQQMQRKEDAGIPQMQIDNQAAELQQVQGKLAKQATYQTFDAYMQDGDISHFNRMYEENPVIQKMDPSIARYDKVDLKSTADLKLLQDNGVTADMLQHIDPEALQKRFVKITSKDGTQKIGDLQMSMAGSGYLQYKSEQQRKEVVDKLSLDKTTAEIKLKQAQAHYYANRGLGGGSGGGGSGGGGGRPTADMINARAVGEAQKRIDAGQGTPADHALIQLHTEKIAGNTPGKSAEAQQTSQALFDNFGGEQKYYNTNFNDPIARRKAAPYVMKIEALTGEQLTSQDKNKLDDIRALIALANPAGKITAEQTGLVDSLVGTAKKYVDEQGPNTVATSAYSAFRNSVRHAMYGSTLTEAEITSFNDAFGTKSQKLGPVLEQFVTSLQQVQSKLASVSANMNPVVAQYRLGMDQAKIADSISAIQERIDLLRGMQHRRGPDSAPTQESQMISPSQPAAPVQQQRKSPEQIMHELMNGGQ